MKRIVHGDETGPRTKLCPKEVVECLSAAFAIRYRRGYVFYSERDGYCLQVITSGRSIVTVLRSDRIDIFTRLYAEYLVRGSQVLNEEPLPEPVRTREASCTFELRYQRLEADVSTIEKVVPLVTWLGFSAAIFRNRFCVETLARTVLNALEDTPTDGRTVVLIGIRVGYGEFPIPYTQVFACLS